MEGVTAKLPALLVNFVPRKKAVAFRALERLISSNCAMRFLSVPCPLVMVGA